MTFNTFRTYCKYRESVRALNHVNRMYFCQYKNRLFVMEQIKPMAKEYEEIDNQVKEMVKGREKILAGDWFITGKWVEKKAIQIPASRYWKKSVKKIEV